MFKIFLGNLSKSFWAVILGDRIFRVFEVLGKLLHQFSLKCLNMYGNCGTHRDLLGVYRAFDKREYLVIIRDNFC